MRAVGPVDVVNGEAACRRFLELLGSNQKRPISAGTLRSVFGPDGPNTKTLVTLLTEGLAGREPDDRPNVLYREWRRALDVVYGDLDATKGGLAEIVGETYGVRSDRPVGEYLFVLHTYFALVARLFAFELLAIATDDRSQQPSTWASLPATGLLHRLHGIDRGDLPGALQIDNLFESDIFGWWLAICEGNSDLLDAPRTSPDGGGVRPIPRSRRSSARSSSMNWMDGRRAVGAAAPSLPENRAPRFRPLASLWGWMIT